MDALLLALLLGLALDQGDRSQRLMRQLGNDGRSATGGLLSLVCLIVIAGAVVSALIGLAIAPYLAGRAGLLFFGVALVLGAFGLIVPARTSAHATGITTRRAVLLGQLLLHRVADRAAFLIVGVVALTGNVWATALGGVLGGMAALLPPLLAGSHYERALPFVAIRPVLGGLLLLVGLGCGLSAMGLL